MVDRQVRPSDVTNFPIIEAMLWAPRERFVAPQAKAVAYADAPAQMAPGRALLEPRVFAKLLEGARIGPDDLVLDVAPGLGYSTAVIARMSAAVIAVEADEALANAATDTLSALEVDNALVKHGDAAAGDAEHGPFDAIFVNCGVEEAPAALLNQLKDGGRLVAVVMDGSNGRATAYIRSGDKFTPRRLFDATSPVDPAFKAAKAFAL